MGAAKDPDSWKRQLRDEFMGRVARQGRARFMRRVRVRSSLGTPMGLSITVSQVKLRFQKSK